MRLYATSCVSQDSGDCAFMIGFGSQFSGRTTCFNLIMISNFPHPLMSHLLILLNSIAKANSRGGLLVQIYMTTTTNVASEGSVDLL